MTDETYWNRKIVDELAQIKNQLRVLVTLQLAGMNIRLAEKVDILYSAGFAPSDIAAILGTSANTVSVIIYQRKKRKSKNVEHRATKGKSPS